MSFLEKALDAGSLFQKSEPKTGFLYGFAYKSDKANKKVLVRFF
jgi:hypothetical protein